MKRSDVISRTLERMDEFTPFDSTPMSVDENKVLKPTHYFIDKMLDISTDEILMIVPLRLLTSYKATPTVLTTDSVASIECPTDFMRVAYVKFKDWHNGVFQFVEEKSHEYELQQHPYTRAGKRKPVVALIEKEGRKYLKCFTTNGELEDFGYIKQQYFDDTDKDFMDGMVINLLVLLCASKVFSDMGEADACKAAEAEFSKSLNNVIIQG